MLAEDQPSRAEIGAAPTGGMGDPQSKDGSYLAPSGVWSPHSRSEEHEPAVPPMGSAAPQDEQKQ